MLAIHRCQRYQNLVQNVVRQSSLVMVLNNHPYISVTTETTRITSANNAALLMLRRQTNHGTTKSRHLSTTSMKHVGNYLSLSFYDNNIKNYSQQKYNINNMKRKQQKRSLSSSSSSSLNPSSNSSISYTGTVKFYLREKGYGFIVPDMNNHDNNTTSRSNNKMDIFVHHSSLISSIVVPKGGEKSQLDHENDIGDNSNNDNDSASDNSTSSSDNTDTNDIKTKHSFQINVKYPFLKSGERVRYNIKRIPTNGTIQAIDVTWLNGSPIPPLRLNYLGGVHERSKIILGNSIYDLLQQYHHTMKAQQPFSFDTINQTDLATILIHLQKHYNEANETIRSSEELIVSLGMNIHDFPIVKSMDSNRGKYEYNDDSNTTNK